MPAVDTSEWEVTASQEYKTGVYYFLNVRHKVEREAVTVKARTDGTYLCLNAECVRLVRPLLSFLDPVDTRAGCIHARFVRGEDGKRCAAEAKLAAYDRAELVAASALADDAPLDEDTEDTEDT